VVPRGDAAAQPLIVPAPEGLVFHHRNAFADQAIGELVVDLIFDDDVPSMGPETDVRTIEFAMVNPHRQGR